MRYKDSIIEVILIEREQGSTYKEISDKLNIPIAEIKKVVREYEWQREDYDGYMDDE
jgi:hypothetical protein